MCTAECVSDYKLGKNGKISVFRALLITFEVSNIFRKQLGNSKKWLEHETKPPHKIRLVQINLTLGRS